MVQQVMLWEISKAPAIESRDLVIRFGRDHTAETIWIGGAFACVRPDSDSINGIDLFIIDVKDEPTMFPPRILACLYPSEVPIEASYSNYHSGFVVVDWTSKRIIDYNNNRRSLSDWANYKEFISIADSLFRNAFANE